MPGDEGHVPPVAKEGLGTSVEWQEGKDRKIQVLIKLWVGQRHAVSCADWEKGEIRPTLTTSPAPGFTSPN